MNLRDRRGVTFPLAISLPPSLAPSLFFRTLSSRLCTSELTPEADATREEARRYLRPCDPPVVGYLWLFLVKWG